MLPLQIVFLRSSTLYTMEKARVLFVAQAITPYLKETHMSKICRFLPQGIQERGKEIRTFMPRFGNINERRNQLHEVIRLSGMNLIINDADHPLIIKVASIQQARMQVYFIDNEDFFHRKFTIKDKNGKFYEDNDERSIFFSRGVIETVKKLGWGPDIIHCHGWMSALVPLYIKRAFKDNPLFSDSKVIYTLYEDDFKESFKETFEKKIKLPGITAKDLKYYKEPNYVNISKAAIEYADAIIIASDKVNPALLEYVNEKKKPVLQHTDDDYVDAYNAFYDSLLGKK